MNVALRFVHGAPGEPEANRWGGTFGVYRDFNPDGLVMVVRFRRLVLLGFALLSLAYLAGCLLLSGWLAQQSFNQISFVDLALPWRWKALPKKRAEASIGAGEFAWDRRDWVEGLAFFRQALRQTPADHAVRNKLARSYLKCGQQWPALAVLEDGLRHPPLSTEGLDLFFTLARQWQDYALAERAAREILRLPAGDTTETQRRKARQAQLMSRLSSERYEHARSLAHSFNAGPSPKALDAEVQALLALGRSHDAMALLLRFQSVLGGEAPYMQLLATVSRQLPDWFLFTTTLDILRNHFPDRPAVLLFVIAENYQAGRSAMAAEVLEEYCWRHGAEPAALLAVARLCADLPAPGLVRRCLRETAELGQPAGNFQFLLAQACLKAGDWSGAEFALAAWRSDRPATSLSAEEKFYRAWLTALLATLRHDYAEDRISLTTLLGRRQPADIYLATLRPLQHSGRQQAAREIVTLARQHYPQNPYFRTQAVVLAALDAQAQGAALRPVVRPIKAKLPD